MKMSYHGNHPCAGCGTPGSKEWRIKKDALCDPCRKLLKRGRAADAEERREYVRVFQHFYAFRSQEVNEFLHQVLAVLHAPYEETKGSTYIKSSWGNNGQYYNVCTELVEPLKDFFTALNSRLQELSKQEKEIPAKAREAVQAEKDRIYNEGVERGKNILLMLNSGELNMNDFAERLRYTPGGNE